MVKKEQPVATSHDSNLQILQKNTQQVLDSLRPVVNHARNISWQPSDGVLTIVMHSVLCRQFDLLEVISQLAAQGKGYAAAPLLRPACEEVIWTKYLSGILPSRADRLLYCIAHKEQLDSLRNQDNVAGRATTRNLGLEPYLRSVTRQEARYRSWMKDLAKKLGWPNKTGKRLPSMRWMAKATNQLDLYHSIYHATSRFVHFSVNELLRRAWGVPGRISIHSKYFGSYWAQASLYWGLLLFLKYPWDAIDIEEAEIDDEERMLEAMQAIGRVGKPPIITPDELYWPESWR